MATAIFLNAKKNRGYLKNLEIDTQQMKSMEIQNFLKYNNIYVNEKSEAKDNQNQSFLLGLNTDDFHQDINQTINDDLDPKNIWLNYIKKNKKLTSKEDFQRKIQLFDTILGFLSIICIVLSIFEYEFCYYPYYISNEITNYNGDYIKIILSVLSFVLCIFSYLSCYYAFCIEYEAISISNSNAFFKTIYFPRFIFEVIINILHPIPFIHTKFDFVLLGKSITYHVSTFLNSLEFLKLMHIYRLIGSYSRYSSIIAKKYSFSYGNKASFMFPIKCELKEKPLLILSFTLINIGIFLGLLLRFFEILDIDNKINFENLSNGFWLIYVALTTVGYGEMKPNTHIGRLIIVAGVFLGTFVVSLTIVSFTNMSNFTKNEAKAYSFIKKLEVKDKLKYYAGNLIINHILLIRLKKKRRNNYNKDETNKLDQRMYHLKRNINKYHIDFHYCLFLLNKDTFQSEDDKFLYIESQLESEIYLIKMGMSSLKETQKLLIDQISLQRKLLKRQDILTKEVKLMKKEYDKFFDDRFEADEMSDEESQYSLDSHDSNKKKLSLKKNNSSLLNKKGVKPSKEGGNFKLKSPFFENNSKRFIEKLKDKEEFEKLQLHFSSKKKEEITIDNVNSQDYNIYKDYIDEESCNKLKNISNVSYSLYEILNKIHKK